LSIRRFRRGPFTFNKLPFQLGPCHSNDQWGVLPLFKTVYLPKSRQMQPFAAIGFKIMFLDCVIGRRGIPIQLPPSILAKNIILKPIF
jgi:hypothetical protein